MAALDALTRFREATVGTIVDMSWNIHSHGDHDALGLVWVATSHVAAVEVLGKNDVAFVLPATAAARSAYEAVAMAAWLVEPTSPAERDRRWFGLLLDERSFWRVMVREANGRGDSPDIIANLQNEVTRVDRVLAAVGPQLREAGTKQPEHPPKMDRLLDAIGKRKHYVSHKYASQFAHPGTRALRQVRDIRDHAGAEGPVSFGWRTTPGEWTAAILLSAESLMYSLEILASQLQPPSRIDTEAVHLFHEIVGLVPGLGPGTSRDADHG